MVPRIVLTCLVVCCVCVVVTSAQIPNRRAKYNFNSHWKLFVGDPSAAERIDFDDSNWTDITLPRAWNEDDAFRKDIKDLSTGVAWYRKHFKLPLGTDNRKAFIEFE